MFRAARLFPRDVRAHVARIPFNQTREGTGGDPNAAVPCDAFGRCVFGALCEELVAAPNEFGRPASSEVMDALAQAGHRQLRYTENDTVIEEDIIHMMRAFDEQGYHAPEKLARMLGVDHKKGA